VFFPNEEQTGSHLTIGNSKRACVYRFNSTCLISRAVPMGRCNTIQYAHSTWLPWEFHLFGGTLPKPSQSSVAAGLTLAILAFVFNARRVLAKCCVDPLRSPRLSETEIPGNFPLNRQLKPLRVNLFLGAGTQDNFGSRAESA